MSTPCLICNPMDCKDEPSDPRDDIELVSDGDYPSDFVVETASEEEKSDDDGDQDSSHRRETREAKHGQHHHHRRRHHRDRDTNTRVLMPTGHSYYIPVVATPQWKCRGKTKLMYLGPKSRKGQREYNMVEKEMQNTIISGQPNCESSGGCFNVYNIIKIEKIVQGCAWRRYQTRKKDVAIEAGSANERMLFHGTDSVWKIVRGGFDERYASTNGQFGAGLYFAQQSSLANQFVFGYFGGNGCPVHQDKNCYICERHLLLCRVVLGKSYKLTNIQNMPHPPPGFHSVQAVPSSGGGFSYPEYVVYRGEQVYPEYLITYKIVRPERKADNGGARKKYY